MAKDPTLAERVARLERIIEGGVDPMRVEAPYALIPESENEPLWFPDRSYWHLFHATRGMIHIVIGRIKRARTRRQRVEVLLHYFPAWIEPGEVLTVADKAYAGLSAEDFS